MNFLYAAVYFIFLKIYRQFAMEAIHDLFKFATDRKY